MYYQNRPVGWIEPPWHSSETCDGYTSHEENHVDEKLCIKDGKLPALRGIEDICDEEYPGKEIGLDRDRSMQFGLFERDDYDPLPSLPSALPTLLLLNRQITDEVERMLYERNTFVVDLHCQNEYIQRQFTRRTQEIMRNIILVLRPMESPHHRDSLMNPEIWDTILGNLLTLGVIVTQPDPPLLEWIEESRKNDHRDFFTLLRDKKKAAVEQWMTWLLPVFEYLVRTIPEHTEIVVDISEEEDVMETLEYFQKGPFRFERLPVADSIFNRIEFAWESGSIGPPDPDYDDAPTGYRDLISYSDDDYCYSD
ncbi:hypothetical protein O1611_g9352 [Lasiodiplodia mahajangana]|uniref:Uncharacterized protein n=1 Tax=Lasiodiplodia mahajangana TaxID=1108764 RepID=A0ACC2JA95_9PEZI|nr:hypothetical protein O1611_g9352 [Lasiodiplodia mahajangana]